TLPFEMDDWVNAKVAKEIEDENEGSQDEAYERLCAETDTTGSNEPKVVNGTAEKAIIEELGLGISNNLTPQSDANTENLMSISELGALIEGCVFTANLVELVNPEESFMLDDDWPNPRDEEDTKSSDFDMDDDYYYGMVEGMADIHVSSEDESSRMKDDQEESASAYESSQTDFSEAPVFVDGKWRTFELDSNMSENEESEGSKIVERMIQNSRDRRERLIKVARAQLDARRAREFEVTKTLGSIEPKDEGSGSSYSANSVELKLEDSKMKDVTTKQEVVSQATTKGPDLTHEQSTKQTETEERVTGPKFKTYLEQYRASSSSGDDKWAQPTEGPARKRNKTSHDGRQKETQAKLDQRTLRELREDLNSLLFDVSSVNLRSQNSPSGKETPLVNN
ncbi:hypothetical protein P7C70_g9565, partial [Phenoliferia sp. Uapishka_3]